MTSPDCDHCASLKWMCISCGMSIFTKNFQKNIDDGVIAVYCGCCDHMFVCAGCYKLTPDYVVWDQQFGDEHSIIDLVPESTIFSEIFEILR
jgi:hypothetical protein